jgi:hypothetical protein
VELHALRNLLSQADLILDTVPVLPENRTGTSRELLTTVLALVEENPAG